MFKMTSCFSDDEVEKNFRSSFPVSTLCSFTLSCSDLKYSDSAIVSVTPHHKSSTHTRFYEMKIQKSLGEIVEVLV